MRLIDAVALVDAMTGACNIFDAHGVDTTIARTLITVAAKAPTVCNSGKWIIHGEPPMYIKECSLCGSKFFHHATETLTPYCACCGGRMEVSTSAND